MARIEVQQHEARVAKLRRIATNTGGRVERSIGNFNGAMIDELKEANVFVLPLLIPSGLLEGGIATTRVIRRGLARRELRQMGEPVEEPTPSRDTVSIGETRPKGHVWSADGSRADY